MTAADLRAARMALPAPERKRRRGVSHPYPSYAEMAAMLGCHPGSYAAWECGRVPIPAWLSVHPTIVAALAVAKQQEPTP